MLLGFPPTSCPSVLNPVSPLYQPLSVSTTLSLSCLALRPSDLIYIASLHSYSPLPLRCAWVCRCSVLTYFISVDGRARLRLFVCSPFYRLTLVWATQIKPNSHFMNERLSSITEMWKVACCYHLPCETVWCPS